MKLIGVATSDSRADHSILTRLKKTNLRYVSLTPAKAVEQKFWPIITTKSEIGAFQFASIAMEELDEDPLIMEGQIMSHALRQGKQVLLIGIDPGLRIGVAVYYGGLRLGSFTFNSIDLLMRKILAMVDGIPHDRALVRVGKGSPRQSRAISQAIATQLPQVTIEMVDEKGTSTRRLKGLTTDQAAAEKIAFRKGEILR